MSKRIDNVECYCMFFWRSAENILSFYNEVISPSGVTAKQGALLRAISEHGGCSIRELSDEVSLDRSTLARNLKPLIEAGYIKNDKAPGKRDSVLVLSEKGGAVCAEVIRLWKKAQEEIERRLGKEQLEKIKELLSPLQEL